jgi:hypothetical protein
LLLGNSAVRIAIELWWMTQKFVYPCWYHSTIVLHAHISREGWKIDPLVAGLQRCSLSPWTSSSPSPWTKILCKVKFIIYFTSSSCLATRWLLVGLQVSSGGWIKSFSLYLKQEK